MKKFCIYILLSIILSSCTYPVFHGHIQKIYLDMPKDVKVYLNGKEQTNTIEVFRSWFDKELVIKKDGFNDYHLKLDSVWTDDVWAKSDFLFDSSDKESVFFLLVPVHTALLLAAYIGDFNPKEPKEIAAGTALFPVAVGYDIRNIISVPILPIWNPWTEYDTSSLNRPIILKPINKSERMVVMFPSIVRNLNKEKIIIKYEY